jgi:hypothetical protein
MSAAVPSVQEAANGAGVNIFKPLSSTAIGLKGDADNATVYAGDVTTGQLVGRVGASFPGGGQIVVFAAAGTYVVSVQFNSSSGSVTVAGRKLWVWTEAFG